MLVSASRILVAAMLSVFVAAAAKADGITVKDVLEKAAKLQKSRGWVSHHVPGGHTHFDIVASDGTPYEICPHPDTGLLHVMQGSGPPGARLVVEVNLENEVYPYKKNLFTTLIYRNNASRGALRHMADKAMRTIMETDE